MDTTRRPNQFPVSLLRSLIRLGGSPLSSKFDHKLPIKSEISNKIIVSKPKSFYYLIHIRFSSLSNLKSPTSSCFIRQIYVSTFEEKIPIQYEILT
ncbi:unnamed protein product [Linum trigynum]|uniref:Uncharacterized protein n=1 Tax=Linum trigynum TaxID=586398 RepID=A0AAV2D6V1_9ROSI